MVSIGKLGRGQARYYLDQASHTRSAAAAIASGFEDYYTGGGEEAGSWIGTGSRLLDRNGAVRDEELHRVLAGQHPRDGQPLRLRGSVPGFDVTFSAPKSVSLLFGIGIPHVRDAVLAAHGRAVAEAFGYLERSAAVGRRGAGGVTSTWGDGLVAAAFLHRTSRAGDPQLHTHVLVANLVRGADGRWTALDARALYTHGRTAGYLYQAALRDELSRSLGVRWKLTHKGAAEIEGMPRHVLAAFSRRCSEIEAAMAAAGAVGPEAARIATFATRRATDYRVRPEQLADEWRERAAQLGLGAVQLTWLLGRMQPVRLDSDNWTQLFDELAAPEGLTAKTSTFTRPDVLRAIAERLPQGAPVRSIEEAADRFLRSSHAVRLLVPRDALQHPVAIRRQDGRQVALPHQALYSAPELLALERQIVDRATTSRHAALGLARPADVDRAVGSRSWLSAEQTEMVRRLTTDGDGLVAVVGKAGTGKTTALAAAREAWSARGAEVIGCAVARQAAHELEQGAGIPSTSLTALLRRGSQAIPHDSVVVVDEAGMVGTRQLAELVNYARGANAKLVLVGDHRQLPALEAGGALRMLATRADPIVLRENRRQHESWERDAVELLRDGSVDEALNMYSQRGRLIAGERCQDIMRRLVADWHAAGNPATGVMIAHRRRDVAELNGRARALMRGDGRLGDQQLHLPGGTFSTGDQVVVKLNDSRLGVRNSDRGVIVHVDLAARTLDVRLSTATVRLTRSFLERTTSRGDPTLVHGYAITAYVSQGMTCERAYVFARDDAYREWAYTTMTRARSATRLYVAAEGATQRDEFAPAERPRDARATLTAALSRSEERRFANEHIERGSDRTRDIER